MLYDKIYEIVGNEEQANAIMDVIRPLKRIHNKALEQLAYSCNNSDYCIVGHSLSCPFSNQECYEITAEDWQLFFNKQAKEAKADAS